MGEKTEKFKARVVRDEPEKWVWHRISRREAIGRVGGKEEPRQELGKVPGQERCQGEGERLHGSLWSQDLAPSPSPLIHLGNWTVDLLGVGVLFYFVLMFPATQHLVGAKFRFA